MRFPIQPPPHLHFSEEWVDQTPSTNQTLKRRLSAAHLPDGFILATHHQTNGRGRGSRSWTAPAGKVLCCSLFHATLLPPVQIPALTMAIALGVSDFLLQKMQISAAPKWPNDLLVGSRKICGILSEHIASKGVIVGIGLNLTLTEQDLLGIDRPATSIRHETEQEWSPEDALKSLLPFLAPRIQTWDQGGFELFRDEWTERAGPIGKPLCVHDGSLKKSGTLAGFGTHGELLLQTLTGKETIWSGEIS